MAELFASGRLIDLILALMALEAAFLAVLPRFVAWAPPFASLWPTLLSGAFLMIAVRFALTNTSWVFIATALLAALLAHVVDLTLRLRRR